MVAATGPTGGAAPAYLLPEGSVCFMRPFPYYPGGSQLKLIARKALPAPRVFASCSYTPQALEAQRLAQTLPTAALRPEIGLGMATQSIGTVLLLTLVVVALPWREQVAAFFHRRGIARLFQVDIPHPQGVQSAVASKKITIGDAMWAFCLAYMLWLGILLWKPSIQGLDARIAGLIVTAAMFAALLLYRYLALRVAKAAAGADQTLDLVWLNTNQPGRVFWLPMLLFLFVVTYSQPGQQEAIWLGGLVAVAAIFLLRIFKAINTFRTCHVGSFYLFLYLCALEILPLLLMGKWLSDAQFAR